MTRGVHKYGFLLGMLCLMVLSLSACGRGGSTAAPTTGTSATATTASSGATATTGTSGSATATTSASGNVTPATTGAGTGGIKADLKDDAIVLSSNTANAGSITFNVTNVSEKRPHELVVLKTDLAADKLPTNADGAAEEDQFTGLGEIEDLKPGEGGDLTVVALFHLIAHLQW